jgi:hypothetical protein
MFDLDLFRTTLATDLAPKGVSVTSVAVSDVVQVEVSWSIGEAVLTDTQERPLPDDGGEVDLATTWAQVLG